MSLYGINSSTGLQSGISTLPVPALVATGTLVANGAGTAQAVADASFAAGDFVAWMRTVNGGAPGLEPLTVVTAGVGFSATFAVGDTSTYVWRATR